LVEVSAVRSNTVAPKPYAQQLPPTCCGGHFTEPYEQNTQQSPIFGRKTVWQAAHS
jgi:hypothetical protein